MSKANVMRPAFQSIEVDPIDARLEARAAEKGIPTLVTPKTELPPETGPEREAVAPSSPPTSESRGETKAATPRTRMKGLKLELPDYAWIELKKRTAEDMVSMRYFVMEALRAKGIRISEADMVEDGRRFRD